uniref:non-specific serine/threonine protein kinase n=1 Tax=Pyrodinium bahamense TaxID=73915 RepID=A0A7S0ARR6_9DINO
MEVLTNPEIKTIAAKYFEAQLPDKQQGRLGFSDLRRVLRSLNDRLGMPVSTSAEAEQLFKRFDFDGNGNLNFSEFFELFVSALRRVAFDRSELLGRDLFVEKQRGKVWDSYQKSKKLGAGSFGAAYLCKHRRTGDTRVVKAVEKSKVKLPVEEVEKEILVMMQIDHPNICRLYEWYEGSSTIYLVLDALRGGTLREVVLQGFQRQGRPLKEDWIRSVIRQVVEAMAHCHGMRIIHKDLKDENVMLVNKGDPNYDEPFVVIIDLGVAELFPLSDPHGKMMGGTPMTMAPEVWMGSFGPKCDVWSAGCILFQLLAGDLPFLVRSFNPKDWLALHKRGPKWELVRTSDMGKQLCHSMLTFSDSARPSMAECLEHPWFATDRSQLGTVPSEQLQPLQAFSESSALKRALLLELAARLPMSHAERVVKVFKTIDRNQDGGMTRQELRASFKQVGLKDEAMVERTFSTLDVDGNGTLSFSEFAAGVLLVFRDLLEDRFRALFRKYDRDSDGVLTKEEARDFLANALHMASRETRRKPDEALREMFKDGRQTLSYEEMKSQILTTVQ